jgi:hypothetical protein
LDRRRQSARLFRSRPVLASRPERKHARRRRQRKPLSPAKALVESRRAPASQPVGSPLGDDAKAASCSGSDNLESFLAFRAFAARKAKALAVPFDSSRCVLVKAGKPKVRVTLFGDLLNPHTVLAGRALYARLQSQRCGFEVEFRHAFVPEKWRQGSIGGPGWMGGFASAASASLVAAAWLEALFLIAPRAAREFYLTSLFDPLRIHYILRAPESLAGRMFGAALGVDVSLVQAVIHNDGIWQGAQHRSLSCRLELDACALDCLGFSAVPTILVGGIPVNPLDVQDGVFEHPELIA